MATHPNTHGQADAARATCVLCQIPLSLILLPDRKSLQALLGQVTLDSISELGLPVNKISCDPHQCPWAAPTRAASSLLKQHLDDHGWSPSSSGQSLGPHRIWGYLILHPRSLPGAVSEQLIFNDNYFPELHPTLRAG